MAWQICSSRPTPSRSREPTINNVTGTAQFATDGVPGSIAPTIWPAYKANEMMLELTNIVTAGGLTPNGGLEFANQCWQAILSLATFTDTGSVNAMAVAPPLPLTSIVPGAIVEIIPLHTNTSSAVTVAFSGGTPLNITNTSGGSIKIGDIVAGTPAKLMKATTTWLLVAAATTNPIYSASNSFSGLSGLAPGGTKAASWTISELIGETTLGGAAYKGASVALAFNGTTVGANGMDTGAVPTSADIYFYAIFNPSTAAWATLGTVSGTGSPIYTGANMPSGYTASVLIAMSKTDSSANIVQFAQINRSVYIPDQLAMLNGGSTTMNPAASISLSTIVPAGAKKISGYMTSSYTSSYSWIMCPTSANGTAGGIFTGLGIIVNSSFTGGTGIATPFSDFPLLTAQTAYYFVGTSGATGTLLISGFSF